MSRIYVGNLPIDIKESEIDDLFYKYGRIREIDLKTPARPPAFAFISFEDSRDAEDAVRARDGYNFDGYRLRCEFAKGDRRGGGGRDDFRDRPRGGGGGRRSDYGVSVSNLPKGCSWQDLKDFMRKAGDVVFTDVDKYGDGIVEFSNKDDMEYAVSKMDDTEFRGHNDSTYIRIKRMKKDRSESRGRSPERRGRSKSRSKSPNDRSRSRDKKRSVSRSVDKRGRSASRSPPRRSRSRSVDSDKKKDEDKPKDDDIDKPKEGSAD